MTVSASQRTLPGDDAPLRVGDLEAVFHAAHKPKAAWRIGAEAEKFGVVEATGEPIGYDGPVGVCRVFDWLVQEHGWAPEGEAPGGPVLALVRGQASVTLEPGAQLELSGAPHQTVHEVAAELEEHYREIEPISRELGVVWLGTGFHPLARQQELPWVPKFRYGIMREFLPPRGHRALDMMQRSATVQVNLDYASEQDALNKLVLGLRFSPLLHAMTANAPFMEGGRATRKSERGEVWRHMDPTRSGLIAGLWRPGAGYRHYVEWALDAPMFLFKRHGAVVVNTGQTFRSFLADGFQGHRATSADWRLHLSTLFPEVRLKNTLELRACDSLPRDLVPALQALVVGLFYDERSLDALADLLEPLDAQTLEQARPALLVEGLGARLGERPAVELAEVVMELASAGLERRALCAPGAGAKPEDERRWLRPLAELVARGECPADRALRGLGPAPSRAELLERTRL